MSNPEHEDLFQQKILVVDDDEDSRYLASLLLSQAGYLVDGAADGEEAWEALLATHYDLLLTDHHMPRLCGLDLIGRVRAAGMNLAVILHSGSPGLSEDSNYSRLAIAAVLNKSPNFAELRDAVKRILPSRRKDGVLRQGEFRPTPHNPAINPLMQPLAPAPCKSLLPNPFV